jgi:hypothetical protein
VNWRGPKTRGWQKALRQLKAQFDAWDIKACELRFTGCLMTIGLGFAHAIKRSQFPAMYKDDRELKRVVLACNRCHDQIERLPPEDMKRIVDRVIELRQEALRLTHGQR